MNINTAVLAYIFKQVAHSKKNIGNIYKDIYKATPDMESWGHILSMAEYS